MHGDGVTGPTGQMQHVLASTLNSVEKSKRSPARAPPLCEPYAVAHLIPDQRLSPAEQDRDEDLGSERPRRHWSVRLVDDFGDDEVLVEVKPVVLLAL